MLLTKPLITFLNANRSPYIHTLLLVTPQGKLLSSSSPIPATTLRAQATLACSIWSLYRPLTASGAISAALPSIPRPDEVGDEGSERSDEDGEQGVTDPDVSSIAIQLEMGIMVIRALRCSLLFVIIGPSNPNSSASSTPLPDLSQGLSYLSIASSTTSPPTSSHSMVNGEVSSVRRHGDSGYSDVNGLESSARSVTASISGTGAGSMKVLRKQAEELAKWLDGELEGFCLSSGL